MITHFNLQTVEKMHAQFQHSSPKLSSTQNGGKPAYIYIILSILGVGYLNFRYWKCLVNSCAMTNSAGESQLYTDPLPSPGSPHASGGWVFYPD